ncbi:MAG: epoxyqueuosine reductase QueH, partial [Cloacibacillus porcorum]|uniref:epoxyqueuosine reductase QueH n=1 Tax=Cloacibacillus porcorum TaxID=1197717 RepID=UPI0023F51C0B
ISLGRVGSERFKRHRLCTTLTISPHKDVNLINEIGARAAAARGLVWVERVWRKNNGFKRSVEISKALGLYRQNYCGCIFSQNIEL